MLKKKINIRQTYGKLIKKKGKQKLPGISLNSRHLLGYRSQVCWGLEVRYVLAGDKPNTPAVNYAFLCSSTTGHSTLTLNNPVSKFYELLILKPMKKIKSFKSVLISYIKLSVTWCQVAIRIRGL